MKILLNEDFEEFQKNCNLRKVSMHPDDLYPPVCIHPKSRTGICRGETSCPRIAFVAEEVNIVGKREVILKIAGLDSVKKCTYICLGADQCSDTTCKHRRLHRLEEEKCLCAEYCTELEKKYFCVEQHG